MVFGNNHTASRRERETLILGCFSQPSFGAEMGTYTSFTTRHLSVDHSSDTGHLCLQEVT